MIPRKLNKINKEKLIEHMLKLQGEDRRLRFGAAVNDDFIKAYIESSFKKDSQWFGIEVDSQIVAACHASIYDGQAELGCSVNEEYRGNKLAQLMFDRAVTWLRTKGISTVFMHCLTENAAMRHIATKNAMTVVSDSGETDAVVTIDPPTLLTPMADAYADRMALYDMVWKNNFSMFNPYQGKKS
jgi:GNAT superfamily N-acetyltransferase